MPFVQQIVGPVSIVKNVIGTVNDVSCAIFSLQSFTTINADIQEVQKVIKCTIDKLENLRISNENFKDLIENYYLTTKCDLNPSTRFLLEQITEWNLPPISQEVLRTFKIQKHNTPMGQYLNLHQFVDFQIQTEVKRLKGGYEYLEMNKCVPLSDRLNNIANDIFTTIPLVGTLYNLPSFLYSV
jgi:hypothetical protein